MNARLATVRAAGPGFTLLETLVALAATAVILTALATAVPTTLRVNAAATDRLDRATAARTLLLHLERELASTMSEPFVLASIPTSRLEFTGGREPGERLVYAVERGAVARSTAPRFGATTAAARGVRVLDGVAALGFEAFDGRDWVTTWHASAPPEAVRIRIRFADGETFGTVVTIPTARRRAP